MSMSTTYEAQPLGFRPWEIAALVNEPVVRQHAEEAAFLWSRRRRASQEAMFDLASLSALDRRVEAHLAGLSEAREAGWTACRENLGHANAGVVFALSALAFSEGKTDRMRDALIAATASEELVAGLISALGWLEPRQVAHPINLLMGSRTAAHRVIGIRALSLHRSQPGEAMVQALDDRAPEVRAAALRYFGKCSHRDWVSAVREHLRDSDERCRFWAAWSLTLMTRDEGARELLAYVTHDDPRLAFRATDLVIRVLSEAEAEGLVQRLARDCKRPGLAEAAAGALGDSAVIPWLIRRSNDAVVGRAAGAAFTAITGVHLAKADLTQVGSVGYGEELTGPRCPYLDEVFGLPMPSPEMMTIWWSANAGRFPRRTRLLGGRPINRPNVVDVLRNGNQLLRRSAALELALLVQQSAIFDVCAPGRHQQAILDSWTS
jgi:uncharacterized protein (TIGR02270 family)